MCIRVTQEKYLRVTSIKDSVVDKVPFNGAQETVTTDNVYFTVIVRVG